MKTKRHVTTNATKGAIVLAGVLAWALVSMLPPLVLKAGLLLATAALPIVFWLGWKLGSRKAETYLAGIDRGAGAVIKTGVRMSRARAVASRRAWNEAQLPPSLPVALPDAVEMVHLSSDREGNEWVNL